MWGGSLGGQQNRWLLGFPGLCQKTGEICLAVLDLPEQGSPAFCSLPPLTSPFLLTFTLEDDTWGIRDLSLITTWLAIFSSLQTHWNYLLIGRAATVCWTCQHVSSCLMPLLQKSHPSLTATALCAAIFLQELEERERRKTVSLGISGFNNLSLTILSCGLL